jgi:GDP-L-fucose synthase
MNIFLSGVSGMVGKNILSNPKAKKFNFIAPRRSDLDLLNVDQLNSFFQQNKIDLVIHAAGIVGGIEANISNPEKYLFENTQMGINLVNLSKEHKSNGLLI